MPKKHATQTQALILMAATFSVAGQAGAQAHAKLMRRDAKALERKDERQGGRR